MIWKTSNFTQGGINGKELRDEPLVKFEKGPSPISHLQYLWLGTESVCPEPSRARVAAVCSGLPFPTSPGSLHSAPFQGGCCERSSALDTARAPAR